MSKKYDPLGTFLENSGSDKISLSFEQIERMIDGLLPASARKYDVWWSNSPVLGRQNEVWLKRGWLTADVNLKARTIRFVRSGTLRPSRVGTNEISDPKLSVKQPVKAKLSTAPTAAANVIALEFEWLALGAVTIDGDGSLEFPSPSTDPGLYRFRIDREGVRQVYIGESMNLRRRFAYYRNPGPTQPTNIRINELFKQLIATGAVVSVDIITEGVKLKINNASTSADLHNKAVRRMIEHAAIVASGGSEIEIVNR